MQRSHFSLNVLAVLTTASLLTIGFAPRASAQLFRLWTPATNDYNTATNWTPNNVPDNVPVPEAAEFNTAPLALRTPTLSASVAVDLFQFDLTANAFTVNTGTSHTLTFANFGIINDSAANLTNQTISNGTFSTITFNGQSSTDQRVFLENDGPFSSIVFNNQSLAIGASIDNNGAFSTVTFNNDAAAADSLISNSAPFTKIIFNDSSTATVAGLLNFDGSGVIEFHNTSSAESATISNSGVGSSLAFFANATAANAQIFNFGDTSSATFNDSSTAGNSSINNEGLGSKAIFNTNSTADTSLIFNDGDGSFVIFNGASDAVSAGIVNLGAATFVTFASVSKASNAVISDSGFGSETDFIDGSHAGNSSVFNFGDNSLITFQDASTGDTAHLVNANPTAHVDISLHVGLLSVGSIAGNGFFDLGGNNLTTGTNGESTVVSGIIEDGGIAFGVGGSLTKVGGGTLTLSATSINTYTGPTTVNDGELIVDGKIGFTLASNTFVNPSGLLGGNGVIVGNVLNKGTVRPSLPGPLTVTGNYTQTSGGDLRIQIASNTNFGKLAVGGAANLAGSVTAVSQGGFKPERGDQFRFLTATGGVNGKFGKLNGGFDSVLKFALTYESNAVILEIVQGLFSQVQGLTPNERSVAKALDRVLFSKHQAELIAFLNQETLAELPRDFERISPDELAAIYEIGISLANVQSFNLQRRLEDIRSGSNGFSAAGFGMNGQDATTMALAPTGLSKDDGKSGKTVYQPSPENRWGVFLTGMGEFTDVGGTNNASGFQLTTGGFTLGLDYRVSSNFAIGINLGYAHTGADLANDGRITADGGKVGIYATYFAGGFYVDTTVGGGYNSYDTRRRALKGTAHGSTDGGEFTGLIGTGYDVKTGGWSFGPTATLQYTVVGTEDFQEHGSLAPLKIESQDIESLRSAFGGRISYDWHLGGILVKPELRAAWQHEFGDREYGIDSRFIGAGKAFRVNGPEFGRDSLLIGAGFAVQWNPRLATYVYYDGNLARDNYSSHNVSGGLRLAF